MNIETQLPRIARWVDSQLPADWEFLVMIFPRAAGKHGYHVASIPEEQIVLVLKELIKEMEQ